MTRTVETELRRPVPRTDTLEQALPAQPPAAQPGAPPPAPPAGREAPTEQVPAAKDSTPPRGQLDHAVPAPIQPTAPAAAPAITAPLPRAGCPTAIPTELGPPRRTTGASAVRRRHPPRLSSPRHPRPSQPIAPGRPSRRGRPRAAAWSADLMPAHPATGRAAAAPPLPPLQQVVIHLKPRDPERAGAAIREAAIRSGGNVVDEGELPSRRLRLRIPAAQFGQFLIRLAAIGQLPEQPPAGGESGTREVTIQW